MVIRLANPSPHGPQQLGVAASERVDIDSEMQRLSRLVQNTRPEGNIPMTIHLQQIVQAVRTVPERYFGNLALSLVLVTDRLPRDRTGREGPNVNQEFIQLLKELSGWPVWVVVRLSTDDDAVVGFYSQLDSAMAHVSVQPKDHSDYMDDMDDASILQDDVHLDVLDDYLSEAELVQKYNPWLNYAYPLHLCRESACNFPVFDVLNDRPLRHDELVDLVSLLFNRQKAMYEEPLHDPKTNYRSFRRQVEKLVERTPGLWNPIKKRVAPWIDLRQLDRQYSKTSQTTNGQAGLAMEQSSCCTVS